MTFAQNIGVVIKLTRMVRFADTPHPSTALYFLAIATAAFTPAHADMVGQHIDIINKRTGIVYQLSDTRCKDGSYRILISTINTYSVPSASPYGDGCWTISKGTVYITGKSFDEGVPINISYDANLFKAGNEKVDWSKFAISSRPKVSIENTETKTDTETNTENNNALCLKDGDLVIMSGKLLRETFPGKPNYKSIEDGDEAHTTWILAIDEPKCVLGESPENGSMYHMGKTSRFQLVIPQNHNSIQLLEKRVQVKGQLFQASTGYHHTKALIDVQELQAR